MKIETTINIKKKLLEDLESASCSLNISKGKIVSLLIDEMMKKKKESILKNSRVSYQKVGEKEECHVLHVFFDYGVYEKCIDARKILKMSVSYIIALSIKRYLKDLIEKYLIIGTDNYFSNYLYISRNLDNFPSYDIYWEIPSIEKLQRLLI